MDLVSVLVNGFFTYYKFKIGKSSWTITTKVGSPDDYINVHKTSTPWRTLGKDFTSWKSVMEHYKSEKLRSVLMNIELGIFSPV